MRRGRAGIWKLEVGNLKFEVGNSNLESGNTGILKKKETKTWISGNLQTLVPPELAALLPELALVFHLYFDNRDFLTTLIAHNP